jgi:hypothetical protein
VSPTPCISLFFPSPLVELSCNASMPRHTIAAARYASACSASSAASIRLDGTPRRHSRRKSRILDKSWLDTSEAQHGNGSACSGPFRSKGLLWTDKTSGSLGLFTDTTGWVPLSSAEMLVQVELFYFQYLGGRSRTDVLEDFGITPIVPRP